MRVLCEGKERRGEEIAAARGPLGRAAEATLEAVLDGATMAVALLYWKICRAEEEHSSVP